MAPRQNRLSVGQRLLGVKSRKTARGQRKDPDVLKKNRTYRQQYRGDYNRKDEKYSLQQPTRGNFRPQAQPGEDRKGDNLNEPNIRLTRNKTLEFKGEPRNETPAQTIPGMPPP